MSDDLRLLVVSPSPELASRVNSALRGAGLLVQVEWARDGKDAAKLLTKPLYELIFCDMPKVQPQAIVAAASRHTPPLPVIGLADEIDDELVTASFNGGLRDLVVTTRAIHLAAVARRELASLVAQRTVTAAHASMAAATQERDTMFAQSGDALGQIDEGVLVAANEAWRELFGAGYAQSGTPLMDLFDADSRTTLKAALRRGAGDQLDLMAVGADGLSLPVTVGVRTVKAASGNLIEVAIRSGRGQRTLAAELERAQRIDAETGLLNRNAFVDELPQHAQQVLVVIRIDQFARVVEQMGAIGSDAVAVQFATLVRERSGDNATAGRLDGSMLAVLLPHGVDAAAWCEAARETLSKSVFEHGGRSMPLTASFGISRAGDDGTANRIDHALAAVRAARAAGGNRVEVYAPMQSTPEQDDSTIPDTEWATRIKRALMKGQFRLALQPLASLRGDASEAHDSLLRLIDPERGEILPGEFLPAARRTGLMTAIDRWVIGESLKTLGDPAHQAKGTLLFVRLSDESLKDPTMLKWLAPQLTANKVTPGHLVFELSAYQAEKWLKESVERAQALKALGCGILLGRSGAGAASAQLLPHLPLDYLKFDAAVFDSLARDQARQEAVKGMLEQARARKIKAIAPGIEDANTMALLWQLGVDFVQGNYLQEPEVIVSDT